MDADNVITVMYEDLREGYIFQYGNHGYFWEYHGKTGGYA